MNGHAMPTITPQQVLALVVAVIAQVCAVAGVGDQAAQTMIQVAGVIVPAAWVLADAWLRGQRAKALATVSAARAQGGLVAEPMGGETTPTVHPVE